jgi:quinol monooxygenase YgiN
VYVITVLFETSAPERFREAIEANAAVSRQEPGCRRFDVCYADGGTKVFLYEIYDDEAAFDAHLASPHFKTFKTAIEPIVTTRRGESYHLSRVGQGT